MAGIEFDTSGMFMGLDRRLEFAGESTHERCEWCGFERVLQFFLRAFSRLDFGIRPPILNAWNT